MRADMGFRSAGELDYHLDVLRPALERLAPALERDAARDQAREPAAVGPCQRRRRHLVVRPIGVDRTEYDIIVEHAFAVEQADIELGLLRRGDAEEAGD